ncbi:hypothetical protein SDC9_127522 [bioreactor metagenome]|uniref:Uncharacterized protein n=1 Tax=bioreactor metagenome TaxID=1076179 RepID=A0A645CUB0_9ZZZZ
MSPPSYQLRGIGEPAADMKPFRTLQYHNILPLIDDDTRTHLVPPSGFAQTLNMEQTRMVMRRNHALALCRLQPIELLPLTYGNEFNAPELIEDLKVLAAVGDFCLKKNVERHAEVAAVVSEEALKYLPLTNRHVRNGERQLRYTADGKPQNDAVAPVAFAGEAIAWQRKVLSEFGAPVDYLLAEDLANHPGDYKFYIFLDPWSCDAKFLEAVKALQQKNTTLLWLYVPGWIAEGRADVGNMAALTGIAFRKVDAVPEAVVTLPDGGWTGVVGEPLKPAFAPVAADGVNMLGMYRGTDIPGLAEWRKGEARQIFCGAYKLSADFLRLLAREAKVHLYQTADDPMEANQALFMLHAATPGRKHITLSHVADVLDVFNRKIIARNVTEFEFESPLFDSRLFYYGSDAAELLEVVR